MLHNSSGLLIHRENKSQATTSSAKGMLNNSPGLQVEFQATPRYSILVSTATPDLVPSAGPFCSSRALEAPV